MARDLSDLPQDLRDRIAGQDLVVFDGECVLCSGFFRFMLAHDRAGRFRFATAQSPLGTELYTALGLSTEEYETNLVIVGGRIHEKLDAFAAAMRVLGWPWRGLSAVRVLPGWLKTPAYTAIARNRYRLFGRYETCMMPDAAVRARFLQGGWG
ncbi:thiol-disulfide oxidoreductase DCC family protein [Roseovarius indicus]|uniref:thiol-disulfide oxidoreductase DCC family protein n=1 Tax=Roseovarius indicus TaxID=540747 RepID=UPI0032EF0B06